MKMPDQFTVEFKATLQTEADAELLRHWLRGVGVECVHYSAVTSLEPVVYPAFLTEMLNGLDWVPSVPDDKLTDLMAAASDALDGADARYRHAHAIWIELRFNPRVGPEPVLHAAYHCLQRNRTALGLSFTALALWNECDSRGLPCPPCAPDARKYVRIASTWGCLASAKGGGPFDAKLAPLTMAKLLRVPDVPDFEVRRRIQHLDALIRDAAPMTDKGCDKIS